MLESIVHHDMKIQQTKERKVMKKKFKKLIALGLVGAMSATMLVGCGGKEKSEGGSKDGKTVLTMACWDDNQVKAMKQIGEAYTKANPNVTIEPQVTTWTEYWTKLEASVTGGDAADIMWVNILHAEEYAEAGILKDLTEVGKNLDLEANFPSELVKGYTVDGKLYAVPKDFDTNAVFYNKDIFDKAGVAYPTDGMTFEDFAAKCKELKAAGLDEGVFPTAVNRNSGQTTYYASIFANDGYLLNEDKTKPGWDLPETIAGIQPWLDLVTEGYSPNLQQMSDTTPDAMFGGGKLAMYLAGDYMIPEFAKTLDVSKFDCVKQPSYNGKQTGIINGLGYAVSETTKNEKEALKFVEYLGGEEAMKIQGEDGTVISARTDAQKYFTDTNKDLNLKVFLEDLDQARVFDHCKITSELSTVEKALDDAWTGTKTLEEVCKTISEKEQPLLDKMNGK